MYRHKNKVRDFKSILASDVTYDIRFIVQISGNLQSNYNIVT